MKRQIYFLHVLFILLFVTSCQRNDAVSLLNVVPRQSAVIVESKSVSEFFKAFDGLDFLVDPQGFCSVLKGIDSLMSEQNVLRSDFEAATMMFSQLCIQESYLPLVVLKSGTFSEKDLRRVLQSNRISYSSMKSGKRNVSLAIVDDSVFFAGKDDFLLLSNSIRAIEVSLEQLDSSVGMCSEADFQRVQSTIGKSFDVHAYLNLQQLHVSLNRLLSDRYNASFTQWVNDFHGKAALDVLADESGVVLNGYTYAPDSISNLKRLKHQHPVENTLVDILPSSTKLMVHFGMSDYSSFWQAYVDMKKAGQVDRKYGVGLQDQFISNISESAFCVFGDKASRVLAVGAKDIMAVSAVMNTVAEKTGVSATNIVLGYSIFRLNEADFIASIFGGMSEGIKPCCYAIVDRYVVFSDSLSEIQDVILSYRSRHTFAKGEALSDFQGKMLESSNVTVFAGGFDSRATIGEYLSSDAAAYVQTKPFVKGVLLQMTASDDLIYTFVNLRHAAGFSAPAAIMEMQEQEQQVQEDKHLLWQVELDAPVAGKPFIIEKTRGHEAVVVAFDENKSMYLMDNKGAVLWRKPVPELPLGDVYAVDDAKNGKMLLLFNTANYICLIDRGGNDVNGYPKRLSSEAVNGLSLFDYGVPNNYRLMFCAVDKSVYNFDLQGNSVEGWNRPVMRRSVTKPVQHLVAANKDYLIVTDAEGGVGIFDRKGRVRIPIPDDFRKTQGADFYDNKTNHKGVILTTDNEGKLLYINTDGKLSRTDFGTFSEKHFFLYWDFNGNGDPDFIYLDHNELKVFDRFKNVLFSHRFDGEIDSKPICLSLSGKRFLCLVSQPDKNVYLIDSKGQTEMFSISMGELPVAVGHLCGDAINLVSGSRKVLSGYVLK